MTLRPRGSLLIGCLLGFLLITNANSLVIASDTSSTAPGDGVPDGLDDLWQQRFSDWGIEPSADDDDDDATNLAESVAGTDPRDPADRLQVRWLSLEAAAVTLGFTGERGKEYRAASTLLPGGVWFPVTGAVKVSAAVHGAESLVVARTPVASREFFRLEVRDVDSTGYGVSDWAEFQRGTDPATLSALQQEFAVGPLGRAILGETFSNGTRCELDRMIVHDGFPRAGPGQEWPQCMWFFDQL